MEELHTINRTQIAAPVETLFSWHTRPGAFERLIPPWESVRIVNRTGTIKNGDSLELEVRKWPCTFRCRYEHSEYKENEQFVDVQTRGPFSSWRHIHRFESVDARASVLEDSISYSLRFPFSLARRKVSQMIERGFAYRHALTAADLAHHERFAGKARKRVAVSGSSGLVGSALCAFLSTGGHQVFRLVRHERAGGNERHWDPGTGELAVRDEDEIDTYIHLAGENIASGRWNHKKKGRIYRSRVDATRKLCATLAAQARPPKTLLCASAIGFYGPLSHGQTLDESAPAGDGFLATVCQDWEAACEPAREAGIRVVTVRIGIVLTPAGGALALMLPAFQFGLGGPIGLGQRRMSWITLDDLLYVFNHCMFDSSIAGPVNACAPGHVANAQFTKTLAKILRRPALLAVPPPGIKMLLGSEMANETILSDLRIDPRVLHDREFVFAYPDIETGLAHVLGFAAGADRLY